LLGIGRLPLHDEWNILLCKRFERAFWHEMFTASEHAAIETAEQKGQRTLLISAIFEGDSHHA
jgi:hypothetical protein